MKGTKIFTIEKPLIFMGIDVHKNSWEVRFGDETTNKKRVRFERPFVENLDKYVKNIILIKGLNVPMRLVLAAFGLNGS